MKVDATQEAPPMAPDGELRTAAATLRGLTGAPSEDDLFESLAKILENEAANVERRIHGTTARPGWATEMLRVGVPEAHVEQYLCPALEFARLINGVS